MADNVTANAGSGGAVFATDDISDVHYPLMKLGYGALDSFTIVTPSAGLPVAQQGTWNVGTVTTVTTVSTVTSVTAIGTSVTPGTSAAHLGKAEDAAHSSGDTGVFVLAVRQDTAASTGQTDGDYSALVTDSTGRLHVNVGNTVTVGTHAVTQSGTWNVGTVTTVTNVVHVDDNSSTLSIDDGGGVITVDGTVAVSGTVTVGSHAVTNAGTFVVQVDGAALTSLQLIDDTVFVDDAAFTPATSKVLAIGCQADEGSTDSVDEGDIGCPRMTLDRKVHVVAELESNKIRAGGTAATPTFAAIAAASSGDNTLATNSNGGKKIRVLQMAVIAESAVSIYFTSDPSGTVIFGGSTNKIALGATSGFVLPFSPVGWFETAADHNVVLNLSGAVKVSGGLVYVEV